MIVPQKNRGYYLSRGKWPLTGLFFSVFFYAVSEVPVVPEASRLPVLAAGLVLFLAAGILTWQVLKPR